MGTGERRANRGMTSSSDRLRGGTKNRKNGRKSVEVRSWTKIDRRNAVDGGIRNIFVLFKYRDRD
jgi:hypothetical protein